jgi:hypothetical protein
METDINKKWIKNITDTRILNKKYDIKSSKAKI